MSAPELNSVPIVERWECAACGRRVVERSELDSCHKEHAAPRLSVGDFVWMGVGYGWHEPHPLGFDRNPWVVDRNGYEFHGTRTFRFLAVVTHVRLRPPYTKGQCDGAPWEYSVLSLAIWSAAREAGGYDTPEIPAEGPRRWFGGWTTDEGHYRCEKFPEEDVPVQCRVDVEREGVLGHRCKHLL